MGTTPLYGGKDEGSAGDAARVSSKAWARWAARGCALPSLTPANDHSAVMTAGTPEAAQAPPVRQSPPACWQASQPAAHTARA